MRYLKKDLPSFMRMRELKQYEATGRLHYIVDNGVCKGFYVLDGSMFKCLFIEPQYRGTGLATKVISNIMTNQVITIATTKRKCGIKRIIMRLGFQNTNVVVQGKQSLLEIWKSPSHRTLVLDK